MLMDAAITPLSILAAAGGVLWALDRLCRVSAQARAQLEQSIGTLSDSLRDGPPDLERRLVRLEALVNSLPTTWEDINDKISTAAARKERAAQRLEQRRREAELEDEDVTGATEAVGHAGALMSPVSPPVGPNPASDRRAALRAAALRLKYGGS